MSDMTEAMSDAKPAPIVLFVYNRPEHTRMTVEALQRNRLAADSTLFIFSDGPQSGSEETVAAVRDYLPTITGFKDVVIRNAETNRGLANSIIAGVSEVVDQYGKAIILEDDILTSQYFLTFMNDALDIYEKDEEVASVSGYLHPSIFVPKETFFLRQGSSWGWATWKRAWELFEPDSVKLLRELEERGLMDALNFHSGITIFSGMLTAQAQGKIDSWAIRAYVSWFLKGKLHYFPPVSLTFNIGHDGSGRHCGKTNAFNVPLALEEIPVKRQPIVEDAAYAKGRGKKIARIEKGSITVRFKRFVLMFLRRFFTSFYTWYVE